MADDTTEALQARKMQRGLRLLMVYLAGFLVPYWAIAIYQYLQHSGG